MIAVAFYTEDTPYEDEVKGFRESCEAVGLAYSIQKYKSLGKWVFNCGLKPTFILEQLQLFPEHSILYIDIDARVRRYPILFNQFDGDIGVHYRKGNGELLSGTIFLKNIPNVHSLVKHWKSVQDGSLRWDQKVFASVIRDKAKQLRIKVTNIPATYTQIFDIMKDCGEPVIEHMQKSRKYKSKVGR
jgi:hypothetical protein